MRTGTTQLIQMAESAQAKNAKLLRHLRQNQECERAERVAEESVPPVVEIQAGNGGCLWQFRAITEMERTNDGTYRVAGNCCAPHSAMDTEWGSRSIWTAATPSAIWQQCLKAGVPCCDPPVVTLTSKYGSPFGPCEVASIRRMPGENYPYVQGWIRWPEETWEAGKVWHLGHNAFAEAPSAIREACADAGVPCPKATVTLHSRETGNPYEYRSISVLKPSGNGSSVTGEWLTATNKWQQTCSAFRMRETPQEIRAACDREGVPCPAEEPDAPKPYVEFTSCVSPWGCYGFSEILSIGRPSDGETPIRGRAQQGEVGIVVSNSPEFIREKCRHYGVPYPPGEIVVEDVGGGTVSFDAIDSIQAGIAPLGPALFLHPTGELEDITTETHTPIRSIQEQADGARIKLPKPVVALGTQITHTYSAITKAFCPADRRPKIVGQRADDSYDKTDIYGTDGMTIPQVVTLCSLVRDDSDPESVQRWSPQVRMVCTHTDGAPCEVDPADVVSVRHDKHEHATIIYDGVDAERVREPVAVVNAMLAACKIEEATDAGTE